MGRSALRIAWLVTFAAGLGLARPTAGAQDDAALPDVADDGPGDDARDREARSIFEAGETAYDDGRFEDALQHFDRAYALSDRPQLLYNIAQAADRLRLDDRVLEALRAYLERLPDAPNADRVEHRIRVLEQRGQTPPASDGGETAAPPPPDALRALEDRAPSAPEASLQGDAPRDEDGGLLSKWWFWTAAGVAVAAVAVGVAVAAGDGQEAEPQSTGTDGMVIITLGSR